MGLITRVIGFFLKFGLYLILFLLAIAFIPNLPPYTKFSSYEIKPPQEKFKTLDHCASLNNAKRTLLGKLHGPESFSVINGELITTLATGEVVKVSSTGNVNIVTKIGGPCAGEWEEEICGRPLDTHYDEKTGKLYVLDSYHGIWKVDLKTDKKELLVSPRKKLEGSEPKLLNSFVVDPQNGDIYWTASSNDYTLKDGIPAILSDPSGRLFHYNPATNHSTVLLSKLAFPNGIALSPDTDFVVFCETGKQRLSRYYIRGPKKGDSDVFVDGLPGNPDNIQVLPDGSGMLVAQYVIGDNDHPILIAKMSSTPIIRKVLVRLIRLLELPIEFVNHHFHHVVFDKILFNIGHFKMAAPFSPPLSGFLRVDWNGNIVQCYVNSDNSLGTVSDAIVLNDILYLGSPHSPFVGTLPAPKELIDAFKVKQKPAQAKKIEEQKVTPSPVKPKAAEAKKNEEPKVTPKPAETKKAQETAQKPPAPAKPVETKPTKPAETKPTKPAEPKQAPPAAQKKAETPEHIPIKEDIPSDTAKPSKEKLKVIKKSGPTEIPNPVV